MMKPALAGAMALALATAGCATTAPNGSTPAAAQPSAAFELAVQQAALVACAFEPTADAIANIWLASGSGDAQDAASANQTAQLACKAYATLVTAKSFKRRIVMRRGVAVVNFGSYVINGKSIAITGTVKS